MRRVTLLAAGKLKEKYLRDAVAEYKKRLSRDTQLTVTELPEARLSRDPSEKEIQQALDKEGEAILGRLPKQAIIVTLCIEGKQYTSEEFAATLTALEHQSSHVVFIIGSSHGLSDRVKEKSDIRLSLSSMTFPHQLARVLLTEQIYRAFAINGNSKYHK